MISCAQAAELGYKLTHNQIGSRRARIITSSIFDFCLLNHPLAEHGFIEYVGKGERLIFIGFIDIGRLPISGLVW